MPSTQENLKEAFAGESQAHQKYRAFAKKAEQDGFASIARLFRLTAEAERIHAEGHLRALDGVGSTAENLEAAIGGETFEFTDMYPPMVAQAKAEGHKKAERSMHDALEVEKVHFELFTKALAAIEGGADLGEIVVRICPNCGHTVIGEAPDKCPVCALKGENYEIIS